MRFGFHLFMVDPAEHLEIARTAEEAGWDSLQVADAPFFPEKVSAPYPYTPDGSRFWPLDLPVLDPWVAITAMAGPKPVPRLNAIPLLNARLNWSVQTTSIGSRSVSSLTAQCLAS